MPMRRCWRPTAVRAAWPRSATTAERLATLGLARRRRGASDLHHGASARFDGWGLGGMGVDGGSCERSSGTSVICTARADASAVRGRCVVGVGGRLAVCIASSRHGSCFVPPACWQVILLRPELDCCSLVLPVGAAIDLRTQDMAIGGQERYKTALMSH